MPQSIENSKCFHMRHWGLWKDVVPFKSFISPFPKSLTHFILKYGSTVSLSTLGSDHKKFLQGSVAITEFQKTAQGDFNVNLLHLPFSWFMVFLWLQDWVFTVACCTMQNLCLGHLGQQINSMKAKKEKKNKLRQITLPLQLCVGKEHAMTEEKTLLLLKASVQSAHSLLWEDLRGPLPQHSGKPWYMCPLWHRINGACLFRGVADWLLWWLPLLCNLIVPFYSCVAPALWLLCLIRCGRSEDFLSSLSVLEHCHHHGKDESTRIFQIRPS